MAIGDIIVGVDIGTSKVSTVVGEVNNFNQIEIICMTKYKCKGIKKGKIIDDDEVAMAIAKTINDAEEEANLRINSAYVTIPGKYVTIVQNSIVKDIKDKFAGISVRDVNSGLMVAKDIDLPENKTIIDIVPENFILEDGQVVLDPVGSFSSSFTLNAEIIIADKGYVKQLHQIFKKAELEIDGIVPNALAQRNLILDNNELNDNIMILDIGAGNTDIGIFEGNRFIYTNTIPLGGDNITNDIAVVLDISLEEADKLKKQYGLALKSFIDNDNDIISQGIKAKINNVILTGQGITNISKSDVAGKIALNIPVKMSTGRLISTVKPSFRTAYSLVRYIAARPFAKSVSSNIDTVLEENVFKMLIDRIKEFFYS